MTRRSWVVLVAVLMFLGAPGLLGPAGAAEPVPPVVGSPPSISGTTRVFSTLTADPGTWAPAAASYGYTWLRDGTPVPGANGPTYTLAEDDHGDHLAVRVVATGADGGVSLPATSAATSTIELAGFARHATPVITGMRRWDHTLTVSTAGVWSPKPTSVLYRWMRDGRPIKGAVHPTYKLTPADFGTHVKVKVVARRSSYANSAVLSAPTGLIDHRIGVRKRFSYSIETRGRITANVATFARLAAASYADPRGWRSAGYQFREVAHGGDFTLVLSSASSVPSFGYPCDSTWSCRVGRYVIINQTRWLHASPAWNAAHRPLRDYRHMVVNHETGHWLGHRHLTCPGKGRLAPIMMQQSKGLHGCRFNPFPLPSERWSDR